MSLAPRPGYRRQECRCGCGCFFYSPRTAGHPAWYVNEDHALRAQAKRKREKWAHARNAGRCPYCNREVQP